MIQIIGPFNSGAAVGGDGVATANTDTSVAYRGLIRGVYVKYNLTPPAATTDLLLATKGTNAPTETILSIANAATSGWFYPKTLINLNSDGSEVAANYALIPIDDLLNVKISGANALDNIDVYILLEG